LKKRFSSVTIFVLAIVAAGLTATSSVGAISANKSYEQTELSTNIGLQESAIFAGRVSWSIDGLGITGYVGGAEGQIQVLKPSGATVKAAYFMVADMGLVQSSAPTSTKLANSIVDFSIHGRNDSFGLNSWWGDVTSIVKPIVDTAPAGTVDLTVTEGIDCVDDGENSDCNEGSVLVVIFDNQSAPLSTIMLYFGVASSTGESLTFNFDPMKQEQISQGVEMSVGIAFSHQIPPTDFSQHTNIKINGKWLTATAGSYDDCVPQQDCGNGGLMTVGGVGDSLDIPTGAGTADNSPDLVPDDEYYDVSSFMTVGDTTLNVATENISDDNLFFAGLLIKGVITEEAQLQLPPIPPENVTAVIGASPTSALITWDPSPSADGYIAQTVEDPTKSCGVEAPTTSCEIQGLTQPESYTYFVSATSANGGSDPSQIVALTITPPTTDAPTNVVEELPATGGRSQEGWQWAMAVVMLGCCLSFWSRRRITH
jgi:hypothetical protein